MRVARVHDHGGPDEIRVEDVPVPEPAPDELLVRVEVAGLNFLDTYQRAGAYPVPLPLTLGNEAAGTVAAVGDEVKGWREGNTVAFVGITGAYAEYVAVPADRAVEVPADVGSKKAAAVLLQGMTAHYLTHSTYVLDEGDTALIYAAAGGVGHLLVQVARQRGATVIATASTEEKERLAKENGAHEVIRYTDVDVAETVRGLTDDSGVDVVYDSIGRTTFEASLDSLRPRGYLVLYGQASGAVEPLDPQVLNQKGSLFLTRPSLKHYIARREELDWRASDILRWVASGVLDVRIDREFALDEAADAHRYIEAGSTKGKVLIVP